MDRRRPLLLAAGAVASVLAALPAALAGTPETQVVQAAALQPIAIPGSTTTIPTTQTYDGRARTLVLHIPDGLLAPAPLVVALHAHSQTSATIRSYSRLERLADEQGFVVAFPDGSGGSWNAGACCHPGRRNAVDELAFLDEVLAIAQARTRIDPDRVFLTGASNGAMMALRYACERSEQVAAVAVVSGPLVAPCSPSAAVSVLVLHGDADGVVPLKGGRNDRLEATFPDVDRSLEPFRRAGGDVRLQVVEGAGHTWMTRDEHGLDAADTAWVWMRDHPRVL